MKVHVRGGNLFTVQPYTPQNRSNSSSPFFGVGFDSLDANTNASSIRDAV